MIKKLPKNVVSILAAGEIVERPYSVVKELIENSLDAGANNIKVEVLKWWKKLIKVSDDWLWIQKDDLPLTIENFATSKIFSLQDIYNLDSFWFRWEALYTISEVSKFRIITKNYEKEKKTVKNIWRKLEKIDNNININPVPVNFDHWTEVFVEDLFYNLPVRKKFLKSDATEFKYIYELLQVYSIKYYDKSFSLINNDKINFSYESKSDLISRLSDIYPKEWVENYLNFEFVNDSIKLYWIMWKSILKFNSSMIKIFVNWRYVRDKIINKAVLQAYSRRIEPWMFPFAIIFLELDSSLVDVNVHPRKEEVKFLDPWIIYNLILNTLKSKLESKKWIEDKSNYVNIGDSIKSNNYVRHKDNKNIINNQSLWIDFSENIFSSIKDNSNLDINIIGQIFESYILFTKWNELYIVDQHAVAERIIFEKMKKEYDSSNISLLSVPLTFDIKWNLQGNIDKMKEMWFDISLFWKKKVIVYAVPSVLEKYNIEISSLINSLLYSKLEDLWIDKMLEQVFATKSCKIAIKANRKLSIEEMRQLILDWEKFIDGFFVCQHGRPSVVKIGKNDIDKLFDRK